MITQRANQFPGHIFVIDLLFEKVTNPVHGAKVALRIVQRISPGLMEGTGARGRGKHRKIRARPQVVIADPRAQRIIEQGETNISPKPGRLPNVAAVMTVVRSDLDRLSQLIGSSPPHDVRFLIEISYKPGKHYR